MKTYSAAACAGDPLIGTHTQTNKCINLKGGEEAQLLSYCLCCCWAHFAYLNNADADGAATAATLGATA